VFGRVARVFLIIFLAAVVLRAQSGTAPQDSPLRLSDAEFWKLIDGASERGGAFHSDNFTSNETGYAPIAAMLAKSGPHGGAYLGVGPEQNFNYIAAIRPAVAVIFDIRQQAVMQHLLFKALFELSATRAEFISRLFSVPTPAGIERTATVEAIWQRFPAVPGQDPGVLAANQKLVQTHLMQVHGFKLSPEDLASMAYVYESFFKLGPAIDYGGFKTGLSTANTNFMKLTSALDDMGVPRGFLGTDEMFQFVKGLQTRNLIIPVQADFAGPKALRMVAEWLRARELRVSAFYISNVEQYLFNPKLAAAPGGMEINGGWRAFYDNLATLPVDDSSILIRTPLGSTASVIVQRRMPDGTMQSDRRPITPFCPIREFLRAVDAGRILSHSDARLCGR
jgi:hypothetical protein